MFKGGTNIFKNVNGIAIKGRYFDSETRLDFFEKQNNRMSLIYGKNGSGKSTIADAFNAYKNEDRNGFDKVELYEKNGTPKGDKGTVLLSPVLIRSAAKGGGKFHLSSFQRVIWGQVLLLAHNDQQ